jgi:hypothetical protein
LGSLLCTGMIYTGEVRGSPGIGTVVRAADPSRANGSIAGRGFRFSLFSRSCNFGWAVIIPYAARTRSLLCACITSISATRGAGRGEAYPLVSKRRNPISTNAENMRRNSLKAEVPRGKP